MRGTIKYCLKFNRQVEVNNLQEALNRIYEKREL